MPERPPGKSGPWPERKIRPPSPEIVRRSRPKPGEPVYAELKAGEASVHADLLLHGSEANTSDRRRCGLTLRYTPGSVRAYLGWDQKGVVVAGDPVPHWSNRERPAED